MLGNILQYIWYIILITNIYGDNKTEFDSLDEENEIVEKYFSDTLQNVQFSKSITYNDSRDSIEADYEDKEEFDNSTTTKYIDSEEIDNNAKEDLDKEEELDKNVQDADNTTRIAEDYIKDNSSKVLPKSSRKSTNDSANKLLLKNCRDKETDDLCRNTLIDYPYVVSIQRLGSHYATATLLNHRWILTVAEEFYNVRESIKLFKARLGSVNCKRGGMTSPLQEVVIHPQFVPGHPGYDLSLLRLGLLVEYSHFIRPIRLSTAKERILSANFLTTYWPRLIINGRLLPRNASERAKPTSLRVSTQKLISSPVCKKMMLDMNMNLKDSSLCLKPLVTHHSLCLPDPGAPIVADDGLWGITSGWTSKLCYKLPGPTISTRISTPLVRSWLEKNIN